MKKLIPHTSFFVAIMLSSILASIGLIGGLGLQLVRKDILSFLPLLIALPAMNAMAGDYATLTAAHLSDPENYRQRTQKLLIALVVSLPISSLGIVGLSLGIASIQGFDVSSQLALDYLRAIFITLYGAVFVIFGLIYLTKYILTKVGLNIDDTLIPIANTIASVLMLSGFAIMAKSFV